MPNPSTIAAAAEEERDGVAVVDRTEYYDPIFKNRYEAKEYAEGCIRRRPSRRFSVGSVPGGYTAILEGSLEPEGFEFHYGLQGRLVIEPINIRRDRALPMEESNNGAA